MKAPLAPQVASSGRRSRYIPAALQQFDWVWSEAQVVIRPRLRSPVRSSVTVAPRPPRRPQQPALCPRRARARS